MLDENFFLPSIDLFDQKVPYLTKTLKRCHRKLAANILIYRQQMAFEPVFCVKNLTIMPYYGKEVAFLPQDPKNLELRPLKLPEKNFCHSKYAVIFW